MASKQAETCNIYLRANYNIFALC